jgi:c-di-GMP-binding flagellar brake protein YcgR
MVNHDDRRTEKRISIPEAKVFFKKDSGFELFKKMTGPMPLKDLCSGGACFEVESGLEWGELFYGDPLFMEIVMPDRKKIQVRGNVRWISSIDSSEASYIGMEFTPSEGERATSKRYKKRLQHYTRLYN